MKSDPGILQRRGYLEEGAEDAYLYLDIDSCLGMLNSSIAHERTLAARVLGKRKEAKAIPGLIDALGKEDMLYSKLAICEALIAMGSQAVDPLINVLGEIGDNQHKEIPDGEFKKGSYPLPRDIAARTLIRLGNYCLPDLLEVLNGNDVVKISEAVDAIGYICFYEPHKGISGLIMDAMGRFEGNELIQWKLIRAMSAFKECEPSLNSIKDTAINPRLKLEAERSLMLLNRKS